MTGRKRPNPIAGFPTLLTPGEVAKAMRVSPKTVTRWVAAGKFHTVYRTAGGHARIPVDEVRAVLHGQVKP